MSSRTKGRGNRGRGNGNARNHGRGRHNHRPQERRQVYPGYYSAFDASNGEKAGTLFRGSLRINAKKRTEAYVTIPGLPCDICIEGDQHRNRALETDVVLIELLDKGLWNPRPAKDDASSEVDAKVANIVLHVKDEINNNSLWQPQVPANYLQPKVTGESLKGEPKKGVGQAEDTESVKILAATMNAEWLQPKAKVVYIVEKNHPKEHVGFLHLKTPVEVGQPMSTRDQFALFHPMDKRFPFVVVDRHRCGEDFVRNPHECSNKIYLCRMLDDWPQHSFFPRGQVKKAIGEAGEIAAETEALLTEHEVNHGPFPDGAMAELEAFIPERGSWQIPAEEISRRRDLRSTRIFTIDPTTAKDLDDALHCTKLDDGTFELGVHIADVSYFVKPGSEIDREATRRATTVYLVNMVLPMLPPLLCEQLCSLNPSVDRLAFSCVWRIHADGTLVEAHPVWYGRTIIRSCAKLDYGTAQHMIDGTITSTNADTVDPSVWDPQRKPTDGHTCADVIQDVLNMHMIAMSRRKQRFKNGALQMHKIKLSFKRDDNGIARSESHHLAYHVG